MKLDHSLVSWIDICSRINFEVAKIRKKGNYFGFKMIFWIDYCSDRFVNVLIQFITHFAHHKIEKLILKGTGSHKKLSQNWNFFSFRIQNLQTADLQHSWEISSPKIISFFIWIKGPVFSHFLVANNIYRFFSAANIIFYCLVKAYLQIDFEEKGLFDCVNLA